MAKQDLTPDLCWAPPPPLPDPESGCGKKFSIMKANCANRVGIGHVTCMSTATAVFLACIALQMGGGI